MVRSMSHALFNCSKMRETRDSIFSASGARSAAIMSRAPFTSYSASFIHNSEVWCWMMNSISSWAVESGFCAVRIWSICR
ncbi:hypothetical protein BDD41_1676 [Paracoccus versutus]|uniref:Uncharacterized protein n=1 Tax=Paracoccus versutus TaxID=34007 RepID=A0A3D9XU53_PARVE|nr:hypothetical protein BDD41_1676 [Paracoccus versutus]